MRLRPGASLLVFFLAVLPGLAQSQTFYSTLFIPYPLEDFNGAPRPGGLGSAFTAADGDPACLYFNPAGLEGLRGTEVSFFHNSGLAGIARETLAFSFRTDHAGCFAFAANYTDFGTLDGFDDLGNATSPFHPVRLGLAAGWGIRILPQLALGASLREFYESLGPGQDSLAYSLSAGVLYKFLPELRAGAFYSCLYSRSESDLGLLKAGIAWEPKLDPEGPTLLMLDLSLPPGGVYRLQIGVEQIFLHAFTARLGHGWELKDNSIEGFRGLTAGLGVRLDDLSLDCSFSPDGELGDFRSISLTYRFPGPPPPPVAFHPPADPNAPIQWKDVEVHFEVPSTPSPKQPLTPAEETRLEALSTKVQTDPRDLKAWEEMAMIYWHAGQSDYALQCFEEVLELAPGNEGLRKWLEGYRKNPDGKPLSGGE